MLIQSIRKKIPWKATIPFAVNLAANLAFTPIQLGLRSLFWAAADILLVWGSILWMMLVIWKYYRWVAIAQVPYLVWVSIATVLQLSISWHNWPADRKNKPHLWQFRQVCFPYFG